jgi:hypothetical protein
MPKVKPVKIEKDKPKHDSPDLSQMRSVKVDERTTIYVKPDITEEELAERIARYHERKRFAIFSDGN